MKYIKLVLPLMLALCSQSVFSSAESISFNDEEFTFKGSRGAPFYATKEGVSNIALSICGKKLK